MASVTQLSIADVESMHSQNRHFAGCAFSSVAGKFVNREAARTSVEATDLQREDEDSRAAKNHGRACPRKTRTVNGIQVIDRSNRQPNPKASSAMEIFKQHYLSTLKSADATFNPCSKAFWEEFRVAFDRLSPQEKEVYQALADQSRATASNERAKRKAETSNSQKQDPTSSSIIQHYKPELGLRAQVLPLDQICDTLASADTGALHSLVQQHVEGRSQGQSPLDNNQVFPLREVSLERAWDTQKKQGVTGKHAYKTFQQQAETIARPPDDDEFPQKVLHESSCGEQCRHFGDPERIRLHVQTLELFTHIIARSGGVKAVVEKDILCAFEVYDSGGWCHVEYAFVTAASAQSGVHKPQQVFVCLEVVDKTEHRFLGKVLKFSRLAYIEPEGSSYLPHR